MNIKYIMGVMVALLMTGCMGPPDVPVYEEILPNESAYVIPLEGNTKKNQGKFDSADYLEENKVAAKRIYIPRKKVSTGRMMGDYKWIPTVRVIKVNRAHITFTWENDNKRKTGIDVESRDSIGFSVGINISAFVAEKDTSTFLYNYPSGNLKKVLENIVKSKTTEILSREFAKYDLEGKMRVDKKTGLEVIVVAGARQKKGDIVDLTKEKLVKYFKQSGLTITTFGLTGGLSYEDPEIQVAINDNFKSELEIKNKENERLAQEEVNKNNIAIATADKISAKQFALAAQARKKQVGLEIDKMLAEAKLVAANKWDGKLPANIMPQGSNMILDLSNK